MNVHTYKYLDTIIHESLHACFPDATEEDVTTSASDIARLLWQLGYRIKKAKVKK